MKKVLILFTVILSIFLVSHKNVEATSFEVNSYSPINETSGFTNVVIFIRFQDEADYTAPYEYDYYYNMFNAVDEISLRDYFLEVSYGQLTIDSIFTHDEIVYYVDANPRYYYRPYNENTNPIGFSNDEEQTLREHTLLKNAVDWVDQNNFIPDTVNLDVNNDGDIDSITFMVSGEDNGWNELLWPHKWELYTYYDYSYSGYDENAPKINGLNAWEYTFELLGNSQSYTYQVDVAVLAHETFHLISAPDLYHYYDYDWIDPVGEWGLMASIGNVPSHMLGYMKYQYGNWISDATSITTSGEYTLYPLRENGSNFYKIPIGYSNEYLYLEYRDNVGFYESTLPNSGLLVYRVDKDFIDDGNVDGYYYHGETREEVWVYRPFLEDTTFPIEFSDTEPFHKDEDGDPYFSALSDKNAFDEIGLGTDILLFDSSGNEIGIKITNIVEHDGYITFSVLFNEDITPEIRLNGSTEMTLEYEEYFYDPGYAVTVDGYNVTVEGSVDIYTLGQYILTYTLKDSEGNVVDTETRTVNIVDTTVPNADMKIGVDTIDVGETWIDAGVLVSDNQDTDLEVEVTTNLDNTVEGTYVVEYKVIDNVGNYVKVKRYVNVVSKDYTILDTFTCEDAKTTFIAGESLIPPVCSMDGNQIDTPSLGGINNLQPGTMTLLYEVTIEGQTHYLKRYIFIIYKYDDFVAILPKERRGEL